MRQPVFTATPPRPNLAENIDAPLPKLAMQIADRIQQDFIFDGLSPGDVLGSESQLSERYSVGRDTLREAISILEMRGVGRMRRGRHGGLIVDFPDLQLIARSFAGHALLIAATAGQFAEAREVLGRIAARTSNIIVTMFGVCLDTLQEHFLTGRLLLQFTAETPRIKIGTRRAGQIARQIVADLARMPLESNMRFGSEHDLSQRFGVSKSIARQVVRLLEDLGVIRSRRGRGCGLFVARPPIHNLTGKISLYLHAHSVTPLLSWEIGQLLHIEAAKVAAEHSNTVREPACREVARQFEELRAHHQSFGLNDIFFIDRLMESTAANPLLIMMLESLKSYSGLAQPGRDLMLSRFALSHGYEYFELTRRILDAVSEGDPQLASRSQEFKNQFLVSHLSG